MSEEEMGERHPPREMLLHWESATLVFQTVQVTPSGRVGGQLPAFSIPSTVSPF